MVKTKKKPRSLAKAGADGDTEQRILDAAHVVFVRRGTAGARMQEIADEAGVNKALLHYYFRNKSRLSEAVFHRVARGVFGRLSQIASAEMELEEKVRGIIATYLEQLSRSPYVPAYIISELSQHPERITQFFAMLNQERGGGIVEHILKPLQAQIDARVRAGTMTKISANQFIANLVSLCVFPFAARPLLCAVLGLDERGFREFIEERKLVLPQFFLAAVRA